MKAWKAAILLPLLMLSASAVWAAAQYGEAVLERGEMLVLRDGRATTYNTPNQKVAIDEGDLIRLRADSQVVLTSREKATLTLGSNAVFHVKAWETPQGRGFMNMLFGRFRATVVSLVGGERFNVKTATATIGVKGTRYRTAVTSQGSTMLVGMENIVQMSASPPEDVGPGQINVGLGRGLTGTFPVPPEVQQQFGVNNLDSFDPTSLGALHFPGEDGLIRAGIVTPQELHQDQQETHPPQGTGPGGLPQTFFDLEGARQNLFRGRLNIVFQ